MRKGQRYAINKRRKKTKSIALFIFMLLVSITIISLKYELKNSNKIDKQSNSPAAISEITQEDKIVYSDGTATLTDDSGLVSSAKVLERKTGTGPFDAGEGIGNDLSPDDNVIRSFDQVTWLIETNLKPNDTDHSSEDAKIYNGFRGGILHIEATLDEEVKGYMHWDVDAMGWAEGSGEVSNEGLTFSANYKLGEDVVSVPGKQTLILVLRIDGAKNGTVLKNPDVKIWLNGNETDETKEDCELVHADMSECPDDITITANPGYNIYIGANTSYTGRKVTVNIDGIEQTGRIYGYGVNLQLYSTSTEKGLRGLEYPQGDFKFDINAKLEALENGVTTDITEECTPILWNYKINTNSKKSSTQNPDYGVIENRNMYTENIWSGICHYIPYGIATNDRKNSVYNSGNVTMEQVGNVIKTTVSGYEFDGIFPTNNFSYSSNSARSYLDNVGCFSTLYFQIFVPDNEASTKPGRLYYLTVKDENMEVKGISGQDAPEQIKTNDDSTKVQHYISKPGGYSKYVTIYNSANTTYLNGSSYTSTSGISKIGKGQTFTARFSITQTDTNDVGTEIQTINDFIKFDGEGLEPIMFNDTSKNGSNLSTIWKAWYTTKKDGTNWTSQTERNNANIEDMNLYENLSDIPEGSICTGMYFESQDLSNIHTGSDAAIYIKMKIKDEAQIDKTYGMVQDIYAWHDVLDRNIYTFENEEVEWPKTIYKSIHTAYVNTEYDENGNIVTGTHVNYNRGNSVLIVGANSSISTTVTDISSGAPKKNYDLSRNEFDVHLKVDPVLTEYDPRVALGISNITVKVIDKLPPELTYVPGSSNYDDPTITKNEDGTTTLVWEIYNCTVGQDIEPITFTARIYEKTDSGKVLTNTAIIEPDANKVGMTQIGGRTSTYSFQVTNLASHRLYKESETPLIEKNEMIVYRLEYSNKTNFTMDEFQLVDILPYNGDGRGTSYNGTYTLDHIEATQTSDGNEISTENLHLYTTTNIEARRISPKDTTIGVSEIWAEHGIGTQIEEPVTVFSVKGVIQKNTRLELLIYLKTKDNKPTDIYYNSSTAQTTADTEIIQTVPVSARQIKRRLTGMVWYDENGNGTKEQEERYANNIQVALVKADGSPAKDIDGNDMAKILTDENGNYAFEDMSRGDYYVRVYSEDMYCLSPENVGTNKEINSKFTEVEGNKQSYLVTKLNSKQAPELIEKNVNAGLAKKPVKVIVKYLEEETEEELSQTEEITTKNGSTELLRLTDEYQTQAKNIENYVLVRSEGKTEGVADKEEIIVKYFYRYNKQNIVVKKVWDDKDNQAGKRPTSIKVQIKDGNSIIGEEIVSAADKTNDNTWEKEFTDIAIYREGGQTIEYTIDEAENEGSLENYIKTVNGTTITNKFTASTEKIEIKVTKKWEDNANRANKRPEAIAVVLNKQTATGIEEAGRATITKEENQKDENTWEYTFTNIPKYDENNDEIIYQVEEGNIQFYEKDIEKQTNTEFEIRNTFQVPDEKINIDITKIWNDSNNEAGKRPQNVTLKLTGNNQEYERILSVENKVGEDTNTWRTTVENLPKYDENANIINYQISEENLNNIFYTEENATINQETKTITNKFVVPNDKISIQATKNWDDKEDEKGIRPEEVTLTLTGNNKVYTLNLTKDSNKVDNSNWRGTFENLPKYDILGNEIVYTLDERPVSSEFYTKTGINQETKVVTNKYRIPTETIQIPVEKIWDDNNNQEGKRPASITIQLKEGTEIVSEVVISGNQTTNEGWSYTFEAPKYDEEGELAQYTIAEKSLNNRYYADNNVTIDQENRIITNKYENIDAKVIVHYYKEGTEEKLSEDVVINKKMFDEYETKAAEDIEEKYELVAEPVNKNGIINQETVEVIYYYRLKEAKVIVHHYIKGTETKLSEDVIIKGRVDDEYSTAQATDIPNKYKLVQEPSNKAGTMTVADTIVTYTYELKDATLTVKYLEKGTNEEVKTEKVITGKVDDEYEETEAEIPNYTFIEDTGNTKGKLGVEPKTVIFYYLQQTKVKVEHIDKITGEILEESTTNGLVGDKYTANAINIEGYVLTEKPEKETVTMEKEEITLKYYYTHISAGVTVKHVNIHTGELLSTEQIEGNEGSPYKTEAKEIEGYELVESKMPENAEGVMTKEGIEVVYYYQYPSKVTVEYIDILTNEKIAEDEEIQGYEGEDYKTQKKEIEGYEYKKVEGQEEGKQGKDEKKVKYYYIHKSAGVEVKHKDIITGKEIAQKEEIKGNEGDEYSTAEKQIQGYDIVKSKMPQNSKGKMTKEKIEVVYYYQRPVKVIVKYLEEGTEKPLEVEEEIKGYEKDEYETQGKEIKYYTMQQEPENAKGKMEIIEGKNEIIVKYYYKKKPFNLKIENIIETITIDKKEIKNGTKFLKQEIMKVDYDKSKIELKYKIIVTNDGELSGRGIVIEELPKGLEIDIEKNPGWQVENGKVVRETKYLKPGEKEEYELILRWEKEEDSLGLQTLKSKVVHLENEAGFSVEEMRGNKDKADAIIALETGKETYDKLAIVTMIILIILAGYIVDIKIKNKI